MSLNYFQKSVLAALYSSEGSVLEVRSVHLEAYICIYASNDSHIYANLIITKY